ncbi:MAG TPA: YfiR family protein [Bacteroidota bacterium]|nr:YfiR family protein [Bacteroidota bacterium]
MLRRLTMMRGSFAKRCTIVIIASICIFRSSIAHAQTSKEVEYRFKAVYILNFLQFVEWPDSAFPNQDAPIVLAVLGEDPFGKVLDETVQSEKIGARSIVVKRFHSLGEFSPCQVLFVSSSEKESFHSVLRRIGDSSTLTVSDMDDFGGQGGGIGFFMDNNKLRFEINMQALKVADLKASSKLLRLARVINPI